jgi:hypothetical protein
LAVDGQVSASTQTQALCALLFLYRTVLEKEVGELAGLVRVDEVTFRSGRRGQGGMGCPPGAGPDQAQQTFLESEVSGYWRV